MVDIETTKKRIISELNVCDNPYVLKQVEKILLRNQELSPLINMVQEYPVLLEEKRIRDMVLKTNLPAPEKRKISRYDSMVRPVFFFLSLIMLMLAAAILNAVTREPENLTRIVFQGMIFKFYLVGWSLYLLDFITILVIARKNQDRLASSEFISRILALFFPPIRLASRHIRQVELTWLPFYGWSKCNEGLLKHLKKRFSIPMIAIAFLIIPVLLIEWKFYDEASDYLETDLAFWLDIVQAFIWMAFAFEFILMCSISRDKLEYAMKNWVDVLIIVLPFISFIRSIKLIKIARLTQLARGYKLRGLLMKARQGFIFASFFYRILTIKPGFQIKNLKKKLEKNEKEREAIEDDLIELYQALKS